MTYAEAFNFGEAFVENKPTFISVFQFDKREWAFTLSLSLSLSLDCVAKLLELSVSIMFEDIISFENLCIAWQEFVRGKRQRKDAAEFSLNLADNLYVLHDDLKNKRYAHSPYQAFKINDPKPRDIHKATVRDRIVHRAIYRTLCPFFERVFIADSYSCRLSKGTHKALNRFRAFGYKVSRNDTHTCWVLKCDIRKFFANIDHKILLEILKSRISDENTVWLLQKVISSFSTPDKLGVGLPLGNLTSQLFVNIYMNEFDQFVKHRIGAKYYIRYADDFVVLSQDKKWLENVLLEMDKYLCGKLHLKLHPDKVFIKTLASGVDFLGWVHFPDHRVLRTTTKRRMMRKVFARPVSSVINSYLGMLKHGNTYKLEKLLPRPIEEDGRSLEVGEKDKHSGIGIRE